MKHCRGQRVPNYTGVYCRETKSRSGIVRRYYSVTFRVFDKLYEEAARVLIDGGPDSRPAENAKEAKRYRDKRIYDLEHAGRDAVKAPKKRATVDDLWSAWVKEGHGGDGSTASRYKNHVGRYFGEMLAERLNEMDVARFRQDLEGRELAPASVKLCLTLLRTLILFGIRSKMITDPGLTFTFPRVDNEKTEMMDAEQLARYWQTLETWPDQYVADFYRLMLLTGIRRKALSALKWLDVDLERGFLTLAGTTAKSRKTKTVPLPAAAVAIFQELPRLDDVYVWPNERGGFKDMGRYGAAIRAAAGLPEDFRPCHGLRHSFASALASSGKVDLYTLQQLLTHSSPAMTQRYSHLSNEALRRAANVADEVLTPTQTKVVAIGDH